jgi:hypothetical protein
MSKLESHIRKVRLIHPPDIGHPLRDMVGQVFEVKFLPDDGNKFEFNNTRRDISGVWVMVTQKGVRWFEEVPVEDEIGCI